MHILYYLTYAIKRNKLGYGQGQREMARFSFSSKKPKWLVKLKKKIIILLH